MILIQQKSRGSPLNENMAIKNDIQEKDDESRSFVEVERADEILVNIIEYQGRHIKIINNLFMYMDYCVSQMLLYHLN